MSRSLSKHLAALGAAAVLLGLLAWQGEHIAHRLPQLEQDVAAFGPWAPAAYIAAVMVFAPLLVPDSIFGIGAGVIFGLGTGFAYYFAAVYAACLLAYFIGRRWLRSPILAALSSRPRLRATVMAASQQGPRLTFTIRLVPINPMVMSYALGAVGVSFRAVAIGTLGIFPHMFVTVYLGVAAAHVTRMAGGRHAHWTAEGIGLVLGLAACAGLVFWVTSLARRQIQAAEREAGPA